MFDTLPAEMYAADNCFVLLSWCNLTNRSTQDFRDSPQFVLLKLLLGFLAMSSVMCCISFIILQQVLEHEDVHTL